MKKTLPIVSICCITYNQRDYIRQCLDGFLMQKTSFPLEIIVHDDASTDGTQDVIKEYAKKHPELFQIIIQKENQYSQGVNVLNNVFSCARGKYIAICEGDDYWTDPLKLQKQVDFLEKNGDFVMCSHGCDIFRNGAIHRYKTTDDPYLKYSIQDLITGNWFFQTLSVVFRRDSISLSDLCRYKLCSDQHLVYELLRHGPGARMNAAMGVYRVHNEGVWSGKSQDEQRCYEFRTRFDIYSIHQTKEAATFILSIYSKLLSRRWLLYNYSYFLKSLLIFRQQFGLAFVAKLFVKKMILGKKIF